MGNKWTDEELDALKKVEGYKGTEAYHRWGALTGYSKNYNAWEIKRRRLSVNESDSEKEDSLFLLNDLPNFIMSDDEPSLGKKYVPSNNFLDYNLKIAFFDLESTDLKGNFGRVLCASFADQAGGVETLRGDEPPYRGAKVRDDSRLVAAIRDKLESYDYFVTWNGKGFDIPFLDTRLLLAGERPIRKDILHTDLWYKARQFSLRFHSTRLDAIAKTFRLPVQKTALDPEVWLDASMGDNEAMNYIVEHCEADVLVLREVYRIFRPLIKVVHR